MPRTPRAEAARKDEPNRDVIEGFKIIARQKACMTTPTSNGNAVAHRDIDEVLLEDGRTLYQCAHHNEHCNRWWDKPESVRAHVKTHADRMVAKRALEDAEKAREHAASLEAELAERVRRRSEGSKKGQETRRARKNGDAEPAITGNAHNTNAQIARIAQAIEGSIDAVSAIKTGMDKLHIVLEGTLHELAKLEPIVAVDPETVAQAEAFRQMQKLLGK